MALDVKISYSWTDYCRLCLLADGIMLPIFEGEGQSCQIGQKIQTCLQLVTYDGDPLPRNICHTCLFKVTQTYEFRNMALQSYEKLKSHLLPLKHTTTVKQYLEKSDELQRSVNSQNAILHLFPMPSSSSLRESNSAPPSTLKIKTERRSDEFSYSQQCQTSSSFQLDSASLESPLLNTSFNSTLKSGQSNSVLKSTSNNLIGPKSVKRKRSLAGPASRKRIQNVDMKCVFCSATFKNMSTLQFHLDNCLKCPTCNEEFPSVADKAVHEAQAHITVAINAEKKLLKKKCSHCSAKFASDVMLSMHFDNVHRPKLEPHQKAPPSTGQDTEKSSDVGGRRSSSNSENEHPISTTKFKPKVRSKEVPDKIISNINQNCSELAETSEDQSGQNDIVMDYDCTICYEKLPTEQALNEHVDDVHGQYKCSQCKAQFATSSSLNAHKKAHAKKRAAEKKENTTLETTTSLEKDGLSCHICSEKFLEDDAFILHLYQHAIEQSDDEILPKKKSRKSHDAPRRSSTVTSASKVEPEEQFSKKCEQCRVVCRSKEYYKVHLATHVSKARTGFPCAGCIQDFRNVEALNRHTCRGKQQDGIQACCLDCGQDLVTGEDHVCDNKCPECDKVFKSARGQRLHFSSKHKANGKDHMGSDVTNEDSEDDQVDGCEDLVDKAQPSTAGKVYTLEGSPLADSLPRERLPPDGAPLDEPTPCHFDVLHKSRAPSASSVNVQLTDANRMPTQTKDVWPFHRSPAPDGKSNDSVSIHSASL